MFLDGWPTVLGTTSDLLCCAICQGWGSAWKKSDSTRRSPSVSTGKEHVYSDFCMDVHVSAFGFGFSKNTWSVYYCLVSAMSSHFQLLAICCCAVLLQGPVRWSSASSQRSLRVCRTDVDGGEAMASAVHQPVTVLGNRESWNSWLYKPTLYITRASGVLFSLIFSPQGCST